MNMQVSRLIEIVYILLDKKVVTAKELSERFEVSKRTIYRDIDALSAAGVPIYTSKGKGGGISLLDSFVLDKSMFSEKEQIDILSSLQGLNALDVPDAEPVLKKLAAIFNRNNTSWIDVDFSYWGSGESERKKFNLLKRAILNRKAVSFDYYNSSGEKTRRIIEPLKIIFKGRNWYVYGFCRIKNDFRIFKITRIKELVCSEETFTRKDIPNNILKTNKQENQRLIKLVLKIDSKMAYRVYDEFENENIVKNPDESFTVSLKLCEDEWVYGYILSYGSYAEVIEPEHVRKIVTRKLKESLKKYL